MTIEVREVEVGGSFLSAPLLAETKGRLEAAFWREDGAGRLVVQLREERTSVAGFDVSVAYLETRGTTDVRDDVREALGLPALKRRASSRPALS